MNISIQQQLDPNILELTEFFEQAFSVFNAEDQIDESDEENQSLSEWFDIQELTSQLSHGFLLEARNDNKLVGAVFVGKQNLLTWPDGHKMEIVILAVGPSSRGMSVGKNLVKESFIIAKEHGAESLIVNTHQSLISVQTFYTQLGFGQMGRLKDYYANGDAVFLQKSLENL